MGLQEETINKYFDEDYFDCFEDDLENLAEEYDEHDTSFEEDDYFYNCPDNFIETVCDYEVLSAEEIVMEMTSIISEISIVMQLPSTTSRILLNYFKWDKRELLDKFYTGEHDALFELAGIANPYNQTVHNKELTESSSAECKICFTEFPLSKMECVACGHLFCVPCWVAYLEHLIVYEGQSQLIQCPAYKCFSLVYDETFMKLIEDPKVKLKYDHQLTKSFVDRNNLLRWCQHPNCHYVIKASYSKIRKVVCKCGHCFCFCCGKEGHDRIPCHVVKRWVTRFGDNFDSRDWIMRNTKPCPQCKAPIQKNMGCSHMTCRNKDCGHNFCWNCLLPYTALMHECSPEQIEAAEVIHQTGKMKEKESLVRDSFFWRNYIRHKELMENEEEFYDLDNIGEERKEYSRCIILKRAIDTLKLCRETLMFSYIFGYSLLLSNQSCIYEPNQKELEKSTAILTSSIKENFMDEEHLFWQQEIIDQYILCEKRRNNLLDLIHDGDESGWWFYYP